MVMFLYSFFYFYKPVSNKNSSTSRDETQIVQNIYIQNKSGGKILIFIFFLLKEEDTKIYFVTNYLRALSKEFTCVMV